MAAMKAALNAAHLYLPAYLPSPTRGEGTTMRRGAAEMASLGRSGGSRHAQRVDDIVHHFLDQDAVVALAHHADHGLGAGGAHEQPAVAVEALLAVGDRRFDFGILERLAAPVAHILQDLRQRIEAVTDLRNRAAKPL